MVRRYPYRLRPIVLSCCLILLALAAAPSGYAAERAAAWSGAIAAGTGSRRSIDVKTEKYPFSRFFVRALFSCCRTVCFQFWNAGMKRRFI